MVWSSTSQTGVEYERLRSGTPSGFSPAGGADPIAALRALAGAAWANPQWSAIRGTDDAAQHAIEQLGLSRFTGWTVPTTAGPAHATG